MRVFSRNCNKRLQPPQPDFNPITAPSFRLSAPPLTQTLIKEWKINCSLQPKGLVQDIFILECSGLSED